MVKQKYDPSPRLRSTCQAFQQVLIHPSCKNKTGDMIFRSWLLGTGKLTWQYLFPEILRAERKDLNMQLSWKLNKTSRSFQQVFARLHSYNRLRVMNF